MIDVSKAKHFTPEELNENISFQNSRWYPENYINNDPAMFEACSVNPKGLAGREDQIFQIIKLIRPELSDSDVVDAIVQEMIDRALMPLDDKAAGRLYKRILGYRFVKFPARLTIQEFLSEDFPEDLTHIIVRLGPRQTELYDIRSHKFIGCHQIEKHSRISGYWRKG